MVLKSTKEVGSQCLKCGARKVWLDPNEVTEIQMANSRQNIRKLIRDGFIIHKPQSCTSTFRKKRYKEAKAKGRHKGLGKRKGTAEARMPTKVLWMRRQRVLRRLLKKYREEKKIEKDLYNELYLMCKGNQFKNKKVLIEHIHHVKQERTRQKKLAEKLANRRTKARAVHSVQLQESSRHPSTSAGFHPFLSLFFVYSTVTGFDTSYACSSPKLLVSSRRRFLTLTLMLFLQFTDSRDF